MRLVDRVELAALAVGAVVVVWLMLRPDRPDRPRPAVRGRDGKGWRIDDPAWHRPSRRVRAPKGGR